jgi:hypothetical protein
MTRHRPAAPKPTQVLASFALLLLAGVPFARGQDTTPCVRDADTACLLDGRFAVEVAWGTAEASGEARVMSFLGERAESDQSAFYWFFDPANFEMGVKMVDACVPPFDAFWVFVSGLTNQYYALNVRDSATGEVRVYENPLGSYPQTIGDTSAFPCTAPQNDAAPPTAAAFAPAARHEAGEAAPCLRDAETACLLDGRFEARVTWLTLDAVGSGSVMSFAASRAESEQSAFFWFFDPANFEMGVKMVDACVPPFDAFWVFVSGLTNQGYTLEVRDSLTGETVVYENPLGSYPQTIGDTSAFPCV